MSHAYTHLQPTTNHWHLTLRTIESLAYNFQTDGTHSEMSISWLRLSRMRQPFQIPSRAIYTHHDRRLITSKVFAGKGEFPPAVISQMRNIVFKCHLPMMACALGWLSVTRLLQQRQQELKVRT